MKALKVLFFCFLFLLATFHISTCSLESECRSDRQVKVIDVWFSSGGLHNASVHVVGKVNSTISFPGFKVYFIDDGTSKQPLMVKAAMGTGVPARNSEISICGILHEIVNINDEYKGIVLEEISRSDVEFYTSNH